MLKHGCPKAATAAATISTLSGSGALTARCFASTFVQGSRRSMHVNALNVTAASKRRAALVCRYQHRLQQRRSMHNPTPGQIPPPLPSSPEASRLPIGTMLIVAIVGAGVVTLLNLPTAQRISSIEEKPHVLLQKVFSKYASIEEDDGQKYMTRADFVSSLVPAGMDKTRALAQDTFKELFPVVNGKETRISLSEFVLFDSLASTTETALGTAFRIFDLDGDGYVDKEDFRKVIASQAGPNLEFDLEDEFWVPYFGSDGKGKISEGQLIKMLRIIKEGVLYHEFVRKDIDGNDTITASAFAQVLMDNFPSSKVPQHLRDKLRTVSSAFKQGRVTFDGFYKFNTFVAHLDDFEEALDLTSTAQGGAISKDEFAHIVKVSTGVSLTPIQLDILFHIFDNPRLPGMLDSKTFMDVMRSRRDRRLFDIEMLRDVRPEVGPLQAMMTAVESFAIGGVAGAIGATVVYPIDLVKTRMQNQRKTKAGITPPKQMVGKPGQYTGRAIYTSSWDCARQVLKYEGVLGFYKGLGPQLIGVAPEKAIKLVVNDYLRGWFQKPNPNNTGRRGGGTSGQDIFFPLEVLAGCGAGASQVIFTNPLEIVKIRLQTQGEVRGAAPKSALTICKELGPTGLYRGASACFLRDIPFSGIYFPAYAKLKEVFKDESGHHGTLQLLAAGSIAGALAASTTTPADVIKTRLQVEARLGETKYNGILDCFTQVLRQEGVTAFFKGVVPRVFRSSPQFGVTLYAYEMLQQFFHSDDNGRVVVAPPTNVPITDEEFEDLNRGAEGTGTIQLKEEIRRLAEKERKRAAKGGVPLVPAAPPILPAVLSKQEQEGGKEKSERV